MCCPEADPRESGPSRHPSEAGPTSGPLKAGRATPGDGRGRPNVLHLGHLRDRSLDHSLGASTKAPVAEGPELLAVVGVLAVNVVEDA